MIGKRLLRSRRLCPMRSRRAQYIADGLSDHAAEGIAALTRAINFLACRNKTHPNRLNTVRWPSGAGHCDWLAPTGSQI